MCSAWSWQASKEADGRVYRREALVKLDLQQSTSTLAEVASTSIQTLDSRAMAIRTVQVRLFLRCHKQAYFLMFLYDKVTLRSCQYADLLCFLHRH
jgi:hypothetical protein